MRLALFVTEDWYVASHRLPLLEAAVSAGHEVIVLTRVANHRAAIEATGARVVPMPIQRSSANPLTELRTLMALVSELRRARPDVLHNVALKPVLYGTAASLIARPTGVVNAMAGLGTLVANRDGRARGPLRRVLGLALRRGDLVIVQNPDDAIEVRAMGVQPSRVEIVPGSGVDTSALQPRPSPAPPPVRVGFVGRLLGIKGVPDLVRAAEILRTTSPDVVVELAGAPDLESPSYIDDERLARWRQDGVVRLHGHVDDIASFLASCHIAVLPSLGGEGVPKALLEACALGLPIVATDVPGCREVVRDKENGLLVPPGDPEALAEALATLAGDPELRAAMGAASRALVRTFDVDAVTEAHLRAWARVGQR